MSGGARRAFLSIGSNLGDRSAYLQRGREALAALPGTGLLAVSRVYQTAPQDVQEQPPFLNQVICLETTLEPADLMRAAQAIEAANGRRRGLRFGPRTLDVDILLFEGVRSDHEGLILPHRRMWERAFVLVPLAELWSLARGMPSVDVAGLARALAAGQAVEVYGEAEDPA